MGSMPPLAEWMLALSCLAVFLCAWKVGAWLADRWGRRLLIPAVWLAILTILVLAVLFPGFAEGLLFTSIALVIIAVVIFTGHWLLSKVLGVPFDPLGRRQ